MESNLDKLNKIVSKTPSGWLKDAERRQKYQYWYDVKFYVTLQWIMFKRYIGWKK